MRDTIRQVVSKILERFQTGDIPRAIALSMFPVPDIPAAKWSMVNRTLMHMAGTIDARGYIQWQRAGRKIKKGAKSFHILAPSIRKVEAEDEEDAYVITGFLAIPVFRVEDTWGDPLAYQNIELPELPLLEVAREWGIEVRPIPGNYVCLGFFKEKKQEIALASKEEVVFFHELAHAAHSRIKGDLLSGQEWKEEIVAELSAAVMCQLIGKDGDRHLGSQYQYIEHFAQKANQSPYRACIQVMNEVEQALELIMGSEKAKAWEAEVI